MAKHFVVKWWLTKLTGQNGALSIHVADRRGETIAVCVAIVGVISLLESVELEIERTMHSC